MKRLLSAVLLIGFIFSVFSGCVAEEETKMENIIDTVPAVPEQVKETLDNKKIIFVGNSYTQNGFAVIPKRAEVLTQEERDDDQGFFYQICKANGITVSVTNWCFSGHDLLHTFGKPCGMGGCKGVDHTAYLTYPYFDYVVLQCHKSDKYSGNLLTHLQPAMDFFREANPNVKFLFLVPHMAIEREHPYAKDLDDLAGTGITVCNWGQMVHDICQGNIQVPNATQQHLRSSYVVSVSESDGFHENMLAGYITALMTYCAITGESAVGQSYAFANDPSIHPKFDFALHRKQFYTYDPETNFDRIFESKSDMEGIQQLIEGYIQTYN